MNTKTIKQIEIGASFLLLSTYVGAFSIHRPLGQSLVREITSSPLENLIGDLAYLIIPCLIILRWKQFLYVIQKDIFIVLICLLAIASISWSIIPNEVISPTIGLVRTTLFGIYLATRYTRKSLINLFASILGVVAVLSVMVALFIPGYGIYKGVYLCGIYAHKNYLGRFMVLSSLMFLSLAVSRAKYKKLNWSFFVLSSCLVFLSGSGGAIINFLLTMSIIPLSRFIKKSRIEKQILIFNSGLLCYTFILWYLIQNLEFLLGLLGKDLTLTGRTKIWSTVIEYIKQKPWFGYGYASFWKSEYGEIFRNNFSWKAIPHSHNSFLELLLALGFFGLVLFLFSYLFSISRALYFTYSATTLEDILPLQLLSALFITSNSESALLKANNSFWILYVSLSIALAIESKHVKSIKKKMKLLEKQSLIH